MIKAIYGAELDYLGNIKVIRLQVIKESKKTITTKRDCGGELGYRAVHRKGFHPIYLTASEAIEALIKYLKERIEAQKAELQEAEAFLIKAKQALEAAKQE